MNKKNNLIIIFIIAILVVGAGAYYLGQKTSSKTSNLAGGAFQANGQNARRMGQGIGQGANAGASLVNGAIIKKDDTSITVSLRDGGSKIVYFTASTTIAKMAEGTKNDLNIGETVTANGTANSDNSVAAQTIQIRPNASSTNFMMGGVNGGRQQ